MSTRRSTRDNTARVALIACGALGQTANTVAAQTGWPVDVYPLPPLLHNRPDKIAGAIEEAALPLLPNYDRVVVGYADCGTNGAVDEVCERLGLQRLAGITCFDLYTGAKRWDDLMEEEAGTFFLTDYLAKSFNRSVIVELGLDRYPELRDDYFGHYKRMIWIAQDVNDPVVRRAAEAAAERINLPLEVIDTGHEPLLRELAQLVGVEGSS